MSKQYLTNQQKLFAQKFIELRNPTEAALAAGYNPMRAAMLGKQLLARDDIKAIINKGLATTAEALKIDPNRIKQLLWNEAQNPEATSADRIRALQLLGQGTGMFKNHEQADPLEQILRALPGDAGRAIVAKLAERIAGTVAAANEAATDAGVPERPDPVLPGSPEGEVVEDSARDSDESDEATVQDPG